MRAPLRGRKLLAHAVRRGSRVRVERRLRLALPAQRHMTINAALLEFHKVRLVAVARIGKHDFRLGPEAVLHLVEQRHHLALVGGLRPDIGRDNNLMFPIDRQLCVVGLCCKVRPDW